MKVTRSLVPTPQVFPNIKEHPPMITAANLSPRVEHSMKPNIQVRTTDSEPFCLCLLLVKTYLSYDKLPH